MIPHWLAHTAVLEVADSARAVEKRRGTGSANIVL